MGYKMLRFEPYEPGIEQQLLDIEKKSLQGKMIKMEMIRDNYLSRSFGFHQFKAYTGFNESGKLVAAGIGANVPFGLNEEIFDAGFGYDVRVAPEWRNNGAGRQLAKYIIRHFFHPNGLYKNFITLKASNIPVVRLMAKAVSSFSLVDFVYLTIPTSISTGLKKQPEGRQQFFVNLLSGQKTCNNHFTHFNSELGVWHTYDMYRVKIEKIHPLLRLVSRVLERRKKMKFPREGETISFGCLYNYTSRNIHRIDEVLSFLQSKHISSLIVCCQKHDAIYKALRPFSLYSLASHILADFTIRKKDRVTLDVRCT